MAALVLVVDSQSAAYKAGRLFFYLVVAAVVIVVVVYLLRRSKMAPQQWGVQPPSESPTHKRQSAPSFMSAWGSPTEQAPPPHGEPGQGVGAGAAGGASTPAGAVRGAGQAWPPVASGSTPPPSWQQDPSRMIVAGPPHRGLPAWLWVVIAIPFVLMVLAIVASVAIPVFLGARERAAEREAPAMDATRPRLVTPEVVAGLRRSQEPEAKQLTEAMVAGQKREGMANGMAAVYGPDARGRVLLVSAIRTTAASRRRAFTRDSAAGLADGAGIFLANSGTAKVAGAGVEFRCTQAAENRGGIGAFCTWDDGDTAGLGVGYNAMPVRDLADLLTVARTEIRG